MRVYAEGQETEEGYLTHLWRENREHVIVNIAPHVGSTPLKLVSTAAAERRSDLRKARRVGPAFDEYWCVFDVDDHPITEAVEMAAANDIKVALSSPCLELWFLIHFDKQWATSTGMRRNGVPSPIFRYRAKVKSSRPRRSSF
ncbi:RloB family protein [Mycolicibacterium septicum]|uniref:RloB family protein n=1 Tax=Mycolicibacterium septicum TaxID=98668 RepID=UPI001AF680BC|nr:RloB domain-containing protein [Mycolicibacterium septicum]